MQLEQNKVSLEYFSHHQWRKFDRIECTPPSPIATTPAATLPKLCQQVTRLKAALALNFRGSETRSCGWSLSTATVDSAAALEGPPPATNTFFYLFLKS